MSIAEKKRQVEAARRALELAERELEAARRMKEPVSGFYLIRCVFPSNPKKTYEYLALRPEKMPDGSSSWYITGRHGSLTWEQVLSLVKAGDYEVLRLIW